jgi:hypothetical protein
MHNSESYELKEAHTRFLFPFFFDQWSVAQASERLQTYKFSRADGGGAPQLMWHCNPASGLYQDEVLQHISRFLFREDSNTCRYLKLSGNVLNSIFHHAVTLKLASGRLFPVKPSKAGVELFLMTHGVGLLSIALTPANALEHLDEVVEFNYRLARYDPMPATELRVPHPQDDQERAQSLSAGAQQAIPQPPDKQAPRRERLGALGGVFTLPEFIEEILIEPLKEFNCRHAQQGLSVYTVARFTAQTDFGSVETRADLTHLLSALAQIEEPGHAGAVADEGRLTNEVLNRKHWAAVGLLSAAHLIADQADPEGNDKDHPFNEQRMSRVRDKYFIPFLMASLQKLFLERTIREAGAYMEFSLDPKMRYFMRKVRGEIQEALLSAIARVFEESGRQEDVGFQALLTQRLIEAIDVLFGSYRQAADDKHNLTPKNIVENQDRYQASSFLKEDLKRAVADAIETLFLHADKIKRKRLHQKCGAAIIEVVDGVFLQDRHFARQLDDVLQFAVLGHFVQVSSRQVLHRFYRLAQEGLDVPEAWKEVNYAISNLDRKLAAQREHGMAKTMADNLTEIGRVQRAVHVLEFVIIGVYAAEVFHIFTSHDHVELPYFSYPLYVTLALIGGVLLALAMNYIFARLFEKD